MNFKHQYFYLDTKLRKVFDENNKELHLTGNSFRVLVFLCNNKSATVTEIGDFLDRAKNYDENHIRQYRYKINTIIGKNIVEYKNNVYSIVGDVKKVENLEKNDRNTDLLHLNDIKLEHNNIHEEGCDNLKFSKLPAIIAIAALILSFADWSSYGYYTLMKFVVAGTMTYYAYCIYEITKKRGFWFWGSIFIIVLFNPIIPIYLGDKSIWGTIDVPIIAFMVLLLINFKEK